jgi:hypothetical protein
MDMLNKQAYAAAVRINDRLITVYKKIEHNMPLEDAPRVGASLVEIASDLKAKLRNHGALTPHRADQLDGVVSATTEADSAAKSGKRLNVWSALMGAHGRINAVMVDVMDKMG